MEGWQERFAASTTLFQMENLEEALAHLAMVGFRWIEIADDFGDPRRARPAAFCRRTIGHMRTK